MSRNVPSLEELIAKRKAEADLSAPKFLSKKERQKLALERRQAKVTEQRSEEAQAHTRTRPTESNEKSLKRAREEEISKNYDKIRDQNRAGRKYRFDWDPNEDTLNLDDPLLRYSMSEPSKKKNDDFGFGRKNAAMDNIHWSKKKLEDMKSRDWRIMKEDFEIITRGQDLPNPLRSWNESSIPQQLLDIISKLGYKSPSPIQRASIPISLKQRDIIGVAETGSGKTLAYLLPMLCKLLKLPRLNNFTKVDGPYGLILVPTRELAQQIEVELNKFLKYLPQIETISIVGGKLIERNILDLQNKNIEIIIATPGRLIDCLERHFLVLNQVEFLVLDECDKMIEMNFGEQVAQITEFISPGKRQNMMFTATMTSEVETLSKKYVVNPATVNIGAVSSTEMTINERIEQRFEFFPTNDDSAKIKKLQKILDSGEYQPPIIIFINYKETGEYLNKQLTDKGYNVGLIHGSKSQDQREQALKNFKDGKVDILIGTNVAARGIDVSNVSLVVNYQMSSKIDDYIHRVGRTGRAGNSGTAITFLSEADDTAIYPDLKKLVVKSGNKLPDQFKKIEGQTQSIFS